MKKLFSGILFLTILGLLPAVEITVPRFEIVTLGRIQNDEFIPVSAVSMDLALNGGYKYGFSLGFSFNLDNAGMNNQGILSFGTAKAVVRDLFNFPLELSYFVGEGDEFCSGDEFSSRFGTGPIGTNYKGLFYFPDGIGGDISRRYNGIYRASGTGFALVFTKWDMFVPVIYLYQNFSPINYIAGVDEGSMYSGDLRLLLNHEYFHLEAFGGLSYKDSLLIRGGVLTHFRTNREIEFLFQGGITGWDLDSELTIDHFYFLMEPRFKFGIFGLHATLFYHPVIYNNIKTADERGKTDINLKLFTQLPDSNFMAGIEVNIGLKIDKMEDFSLHAAPCFSFLSNNINWDAKLRFNLLGFDQPTEMFELFIGVSTSF